MMNFEMRNGCDCGGNFLCYYVMWSERSKQLWRNLIIIKILKIRDWYQTLSADRSDIREVCWKRLNPQLGFNVLCRK